MAVKPITNPTPPNPNQVKSVNRAEQVSMNNYKHRSSNREQSVNPAVKEKSNTYSIDLKDIDTAIISHVKDVMKLKIEENNELVDVPVLYGNEERWVNARKRGALRDKNGSLILPLLMLKRTGVDRNELSGQGFEWDVNGEYIQIVRSSTYSKDNKYDNFMVQQGKKPVTDYIVTGMPLHLSATYEFAVWTQYMTQMNHLVEQFISQSNRYWGSAGNYKFHVSMDGSISDATEITAGADRIIKTNFSVILNGYIIPEYISTVINKKTFNAKKTFSKSKITFKEKIQV